MGEGSMDYKWKILVMENNGEIFTIKRKLEEVKERLDSIEELIKKLDSLDNRLRDFLENENND